MIAALTITLAVSGAVSQAQIAKPLQGNKPCAFPLAAQDQFVAGPVRFVARVTPDGATESVEISAVPLPDLGFEEAVRSCVAAWRFEPAEGETDLRRYEGSVRYRVAPAEEAAVRQLLEDLSTAWNGGEKVALEELETRRDEVPGLPTLGEPFLHELVQATGAPPNCRMELDGDVSSLRFRRRDLVEVRQAFACAPKAEVASTPSPANVGALDLTTVKGPRGWRFDQAAIDAVRQWQYAPTLVDGRPVPVIMTMKVEFRLE